MSYQLLLALTIGGTVGAAIVTFFLADKVYDKLYFLQNHLKLMKTRLNYLKEEQDLQRDFSEEILLEHSIAITELERGNNAK